MKSAIDKTLSKKKSNKISCIRHFTVSQYLQPFSCIILKRSLFKIFHHNLLKSFLLNSFIVIHITLHTFCVRYNHLVELFCMFNYFFVPLSLAQTFTTLCCQVVVMRSNLNAFNKCH